MTPCAAFEDRLIDYPDLHPDDCAAVNEHVADCLACRGYLATLREIDAKLMADVGSIRMNPARYAEVKRQTERTVPVRRASRLPECLDFAAASAVCAFGYTLAWQTGLFAYVVMALFPD
jgi:anti-sigma factor RsiW